MLGITRADLFDLARGFDWRSGPDARGKPRFEILRLGRQKHIFAEKQSRQVTENTRERPRIGQNKANFGHSLDRQIRKANLLFHQRIDYDDGAIVEMVLWRVPSTAA